MNFTLTKSAPLQKMCYIFSDVFTVIVGFPSHGYRMNHIVACVVNGFIAIATVFLNASTVITIWRSSRLKEKLSFFLIMVQSLIDLGVGMVAGPIFTSFLASEINGNASCWLYLAARRTSSMATILSIMVLSGMNFERYMGVVHPFVHRCYVTRRKLLTYVIIFCLFCVILFAISFVYKKPLLIFSGVIVVVFIITTVFSQTRIFLVAKKASGQIAIDVNTARTDLSLQNRNRRRFLSELKLAKSCYFIVICYLVCYLPANILVRLITMDFFDRVVFRTWTVTFVMLNSSINSVIFFWTNRVLRHEAKMVLRSTRRLQRPT